MTGKIQKLGRAASLARDLYALNLQTPDDVPRRLQLPSPKFACLLIWDAAGTSPDTIARVVQTLVDSGCSYFSAWGSSCELVHDIFDEVEVGDGLDFDESASAVTTWHEDDSLEEALRFFLRDTNPMDRLRGATKCGLAIVLGDTDGRWDRVQSALAQPAEFLATEES